jgi:hypothetical protein
LFQIEQSRLGPILARNRRINLDESGLRNVHPKRFESAKNARQSSLTGGGVHFG